MGEPRYGRIHLRPTPSGPEFLPVPPPYPPGRGEYYSDDDRYTMKGDRHPRHISTTPQTPSPPPVRRERAPSGDPPVYIQSIHKGRRVEEPATSTSRNARVPSPPRSSWRWEKRPKEDRRLSAPEGIPTHGPMVPPPQSPPPFGRKRSSTTRKSRPITPEVSNPNSDQELLSPPTNVRNVSPLGIPSTQLQRSKSERTPNSSRPSLTPAYSDWAGRSWSNVSGSSFLGDKAYQYRPLEEQSIRLIRIYPERMTTIKCEIVHVSLEDPPLYIAVSYAWGDPRDTRMIEIEGYPISVSASLHGAFQALRQRVESVLVWVDALSIDQQNRDERAQQVQLMPDIYSNAESVAIWLGPEEDDSSSAVDFLDQVAGQAEYPDKVSRLLAAGARNGDLAAVVSLFERDYWRRLWVVQEVFNAREIHVYCGTTKLSWDSYQLASDAFSKHRGDMAFRNDQIEGRRAVVSTDQFSYAQVLIYQGPASLPDLRVYMDDGEGALLEILRACRRKLASDPRDKLFGLLGVLPDEIRNEFRADYNLPVKDVYTQVVDYLLKTTQCLDVICEAIHFPVHTSSAKLPSFVPDWSHIPQTTSLACKFRFSAAGSSKARCAFDERLNKLEISAIPLDTIKNKGIAVGTLCNLGDYLMAFLHWRALLLDSFRQEDDESRQRAEEDLATTLSLGQIPSPYNWPSEWRTACYSIFANLIHERLPYLPLDRTLYDYLNVAVAVRPEVRREYLQRHFGDRMMGRCFCITQEKRIGMGTGFMLPGDQVVVPLGCSTPILLRPEGTRGEYRFVGDVYISGYMNGRAAEQWKTGKRSLKKYVLH
ncbi:HET domain-containing protein [Fusarium keratoplasticum]|uniref:HET domain-containing protein n=1 Tax=Fusarium keratoplasticum TaxID=1328300 RepID=A0ACC0QIR6_9HYPO|nr:HET domain-containing protein [Fusarium keratoplasticum]KAI8652619.1 HET domain-containing protein [Fusarium keratoplasticum]KAI8653342.1 HET domain-containing protein [Fusarium keratoplasticum]